VGGVTKDPDLERLGIAYPPCGIWIGDGWRPVVFAALEHMLALGWSGKLVQVKEKFGGLRIYAENLSAEMQKIVDDAETACRFLCEECGAIADDTSPYTNTMWVVTNCVTCRKKLPKMEKVGKFVMRNA
jgi:hypothetical protein